MSNLINVKKKSGLSIVNKSATVSEITIYSDIGASFWGDTVTAESFSEELKNIPDSVNEIHVRINSGGGDVFEGYAIYNRLKQHKAKIISYVDGIAASIASIIALAGDEVIFSEVSSMMIHKPWACACGDSNQLMDVINRLDDIEEQLIGVYQRKTGKDRAEIRKLMAETTWFNAEQAIEFGLGDKQVDSEDVVAYAASANLPWMNNGPKFNSGSDIVNNKVDNLLKEVGDFLAR